MQLAMWVCQLLWNLFLKETNGFMLNVTDQYCSSPATSKGGFSCHPGICHGSVIYVTGHVSRKSKTQGFFCLLEDKNRPFTLARKSAYSEVYHWKKWLSVWGWKKKAAAKKRSQVGYSRVATKNTKYRYIGRY